MIVESDFKVFEENGLTLNREQKKAFNHLIELIFLGKIKIEPVENCFCGKSKFTLLSRYDRFGLPFGTKICHSCGLVSQTIRIHSDSLPLFYELIYWPLVSGKIEYLTPPKKDENSFNLLDFLPNKMNSINIFEIGCGSGQRIVSLKEELKSKIESINMIGCDYSFKALALAKEKGVNVIQGGIEDLAQLGKCDILIMSHVFEHFPDLKYALKYIEKLTHPNSLVYIEVPGIIDLENKSEYEFNYQLYCVLAHTYNFSLSTLESVFATKNFELLKGDEYIRAIFRKGKGNKSAPSSFNRTMESLRKAKINQTYFEKRRNHPITKYIRNLVKAFLGKIKDEI
ncbi:class I SAM-dependent methyltransferase [Leptospira levettii]|uniref:class I SAM-dependent methyltransferase n=1 Tax=Leptospira levettii TaxID=2023178 RepID=UPI00223E6980|nr:class I SAM-dependent methyltransferase [Leptospira levettii]MCW7497032.1 class I SAM-dependent methyltransferase [Leptospira levettii]